MAAHDHDPRNAMDSGLGPGVIISMVLAALVITVLLVAMWAH